MSSVWVAESVAGRKTSSSLTLNLACYHLPLLSIMSSTITTMSFFHYATYRRSLKVRLFSILLSLSFFSPDNEMKTLLIQINIGTRKRLLAPRPMIPVVDTQISKDIHTVSLKGDNLGNNLQRLVVRLLVLRSPVYG